MMIHRKDMSLAKFKGRNRGFSIISAIFIVVVLAALAAAIVTVATSQERGAAVDLSGTRAYLAARAGLEWGMYQVNSSSPNVPDSRVCPGGTNTVNSFTMPNVNSAPTLAPFTVTVKCTQISDPTGFGGHKVYQIDSWACNTPVGGWSATSTACPGTLGENYVERYVRVFM